MTYDVTIDGKTYRLDLLRAGDGWQCRLDGLEVSLDVVRTRPDVLSVLIDGKAYEVKRDHAGGEMHLWVGSRRYAAELRDPRSLRGRLGSAVDGEGPRKLLAPMSGKVVRVLLSEGAEVEAGQGVVVVEAMKMQNEIKSPKKGVVQRIVASEGVNVNAGEVLAIVE